MSFQSSDIVSQTSICYTTLCVPNLEIITHFFYNAELKFNDTLIKYYLSFQNPLVITYCLSAS